MLEKYTWLFVVALIAAFLDAFGIGANDVANSFSTSVASRSITLKQCIIIASICEFLGAYLLGANTVQTIKGGILKAGLFKDSPEVLMLGMVCALVGSFSWTMYATYMEWPVSSTHSIIGGIVGVGIAAFGPSCVDWSVKTGILKIVISWFVSPVLSAIVATLIFMMTKHLVLKHRNSFERGLVAIPFYFAFTVTILSLYMLLKRGKNLDYLIVAAIVSLLSVFVAIVSYFTFSKWVERRLKNNEDLKWYHIFVVFLIKPRPKLANNNATTSENLENKNIDVESNEPELHLPKRTDKLFSVCSKIKSKILFGVNQDVYEQNNHKVTEIHNNALKFDDRTEYMYSFLQVFTACIASFAHGSNDVANAVGPLAAVYSIWKTSELPQNTPVDSWILIYGGVGIVMGLAILGYKIIRTLGSKITYVSPSRGFCMQLGTALTVVTGSKVGIPLSTTHCITGATVGVGLCNGTLGTLNWKVLISCFFSWIITLPFSGVVSGLLFAFASRSPKL